MYYRSIIVRTEIEMLHCWPDAPDEVYFLRTDHRHLFKIELEIAVTHDDRDLEFIMVKDALNEYLRIHKDHYPRSISCEQLAEDIIEYARKKYRAVKISCRVFEDGENGCNVEYLQDISS